MITFTGVNWLAVLVGTVFSMILGALWYGPLFGNTWLRLIGKAADELEANALDYIKTAIAALVAMLLLNMVVVSFGAQSFVDGLIAGVLVFIGFGATMTFVYTNFEGPEERIWLLYVAYQVVVFAIMGGVFAIWV